MSTVAAPASLKLARRRTPIVLIAIGCVIALIAFGPRSTLGQFLSPLSFDRGWGREAFSLAIGDALWFGVAAAALAVVLVAVLLPELPLRQHVGEARAKADSEGPAPVAAFE